MTGWFLKSSTAKSGSFNSKQNGDGKALFANTAFKKCWNCTVLNGTKVKLN